MSYNWNTIYSIKRECGAYYGVFDTTIENRKVRIYISVTTTIDEYGGKRVCFAHVYFEQSANNISDSLFHGVSDDILYLLEQNLGDVNNLSKVALIECYCVKTMPDHIAFTSGDYFVKA